MKSRNLINVMISILVLTLVMAGCSGGASSSAPEQPAAESAASEAPSASTPTGIVPTEVKIAGGITGGSWNIAGTIIGNFLPTDIPGIRTTVTPGAGLSNIVAIQNGELQLSFSKSPTTFDAYAGKDPFPQVMDKIMNMAYLYDEASHVVVSKDSGINTIDDLRGKRLTTYAPGNSNEVICRDILSVYGLTYDDMGNVTFSNLNDAVEMLKDNQTDAVFCASAIPVAALMDAASVREIKVLEIPADKLEELKKISPSYIKNVIPPGTYRGQVEEVVTIGTAQHLIVSSDLDEGFVYEMTKSIVNNLDKLASGHAVYAEMTLESMAKDLGMPMHPGAIKYYQEIGAMK